MLEVQQNYLPRSPFIAKFRFLWVEDVNPQSWFYLIEKIENQHYSRRSAARIRSRRRHDLRYLFVLSTTCHYAVCDPVLPRTSRTAVMLALSGAL